jgi:hypothetical protein
LPARKHGANARPGDAIDPGEDEGSNVHLAEADTELGVG